ncbi:MAG: Dam family site-specific DNA-(adenine-N6)-methyltransferase [Candidatus Cloacimonetes bacterium]|nr:Dam family site-specific DNA-(adenine-N6)-methyltransferase [Candidatus Cloacimonadota bacterium]
MYKEENLCNENGKPKQLKWSFENIRSPFFYVGDKYKLINQLKENFPADIDRFIEPFCGGGSVFLNTNARSYALNDIDTNIVNLHNFLMSYSENKSVFWNEIKSTISRYQLSASFMGKAVPEDMRRQNVKTYFARYNKLAYTTMKNDFNANRSPFLLYLLLIYGFNRFLRFNSKNEFNLPVGNVDFNFKVEKALNDYLDYVEGKEINFYNLDFVDFLKDIKLKSNDFVYLDPPYLISASEYNKVWNEENETRLINTLDWLNTNSIRFAVSNILTHKKKHNDIFHKWAQKYNIVKIKSNYISFHDNSEKDTVEVLVKNY